MQQLLPLRICVALTCFALIVFSNGCESRPPVEITKLTGMAGNPQVNQLVSKPTPRDGSYVGSSACAECHAEIDAEYRGHPMAHSASQLNGNDVAEDFSLPTFPAPQGFHYRVEKTNSGMSHHEERRDSSGNVLVSHSKEIRVAIGSGKRGKTYLSSDSGLLFQSPITWYSTTKRWDLAPGYANRNLHFERRITHECVMCHVGRIHIGNGDVDRFGDPPFLEFGIGCESCHGPGKEHISFRRISQSPEPQFGVADPIINPSMLSIERREAVCNQCHLPTSQRILRYGRSHTDFRPGDSLHDIWVTLIRTTGVDESGATEAVSHVPQMHSSRCYQASNGRLGCNSCHTPHRVPLESEKTAFYRDKCLKCHNAQERQCTEAEGIRQISNDSCIECHMPRLDANNVPHTSQTDHRILRKKHRFEEQPNAGSIFTVFGDGADVIPQSEVTRARGILMSQFAQRDQDRLLAAAAVETLESVSNLFVDDIPLLGALASAYSLENRPQRARELWQQVLAINPRSEEGWRGIGMLAHDAGELEEGIAALRHAMELNPHDRIAIGRSVHILGMLKRFDEAIPLAELAIKKFPYDPQLHQWISNAYRAVGRAADADNHQRLYRALDPKAGGGTP